MKVVFFENIYYDYEFGVVWPIGIVPHLIRIFSIVRHLSREPDVWAENRIFTNFLKSLKHV